MTTTTSRSTRHHPHPGPLAGKIGNRVAFRHGVEVCVVADEPAGGHQPQTHPPPGRRRTGGANR